MSMIFIINLFTMNLVIITTPTFFIMIFIIIIAIYFSLKISIFFQAYFIGNLINKFNQNLTFNYISIKLFDF
jgi:hypothetical protein